MPPRYNPTPDERRALEALAEEVAGVQRTLVANHPGLAQPDRGAHQPQLGGGKVLLHVSDRLPPELAGLGIFVPTGATPRIGIGRMSNGLGCPHAETEADFLGLMVAFRAPDGRRVDFITINDPGAPYNPRMSMDGGFMPQPPTFDMGPVDLTGSVACSVPHAAVAQSATTAARRDTRAVTSASAEDSRSE